MWAFLVYLVVLGSTPVATSTISNSTTTSSTTSTTTTYYGGCAFYIRAAPRGGERAAAVGEYIQEEFLKHNGYPVYYNKDEPLIVLQNSGPLSGNTATWDLCNRSSTDEVAPCNETDGRWAALEMDTPGRPTTGCMQDWCSDSDPCDLCLMECPSQCAFYIIPTTYPVGQPGALGTYLQDTVQVEGAPVFYNENNPKIVVQYLLGDNNSNHSGSLFSLCERDDVNQPSYCNETDRWGVFPGPVPDMMNLTVDLVPDMLNLSADFLCTTSTTSTTTMTTSTRTTSTKTTTTVSTSTRTTSTRTTSTRTTSTTTISTTTASSSTLTTSSTTSVSSTSSSSSSSTTSTLTSTKTTTSSSTSSVSSTTSTTSTLSSTTSSTISETKTTTSSSTSSASSTTSRTSTLSSTTSSTVSSWTSSTSSSSLTSTVTTSTTSSSSTSSTSSSSFTATSSTTSTSSISATTSTTSSTSTFSTSSSSSTATTSTTSTSSISATTSTTSSSSISFTTTSSSTATTSTTSTSSMSSTSSSSSTSSATTSTTSSSSLSSTTSSSSTATTSSTSSSTISSTSSSSSTATTSTTSTSSISSTSSSSSTSTVTTSTTSTSSISSTSSSSTTSTVTTSTTSTSSISSTSSSSSTSTVTTSTTSSSSISSTTSSSTTATTSTTSSSSISSTSSSSSTSTATASTTTTSSISTSSSFTISTTTTSTSTISTTTLSTSTSSTSATATGTTTPSPCYEAPLVLHGGDNTHCLGMLHGEECEAQCLPAHRMVGGTVTCVDGTFNVHGACLEDATADAVDSGGAAPTISVGVLLSLEVSVGPQSAFSYEWVQDNYQLVLESVASILQVDPSVIALEITQSVTDIERRRLRARFLQSIGSSFQMRIRSLIPNTLTGSSTAIVTPLRRRFTDLVWVSRGGYYMPALFVAIARIVGSVPQGLQAATLSAQTSADHTTVMSFLPAIWILEPWSACSCPGQLQQRSIYCTVDHLASCDNGEPRPLVEQPCSCPAEPAGPAWVAVGGGAAGFVLLCICLAYCWRLSRPSHSGIRRLLDNQEVSVKYKVELPGKQDKKDRKVHVVWDVDMNDFDVLFSGREEADAGDFSDSPRQTEGMGGTVPNTPEVGCPMYANGDPVEYFSTTHKCWLHGTVRLQRRLTEQGTEATYNVYLPSSGQWRYEVSAEMMREPFKENEPVEIFSHRSDGTWLPGIICSDEVSHANFRVLGHPRYSVQLTTQAVNPEVLHKVSAGRLRRRFPPDSQVQVYRGSQRGWVLGMTSAAHRDGEDPVVPVIEAGLEGLDWVPAFLVRRINEI